MDADAATANQVESDFHKIISRIAFAIVHHASNIRHSVVVEGSAANAKLLVDFNVHFLALVVPRSSNHLEGFVKAVGNEHRTVNVLLEVGSDRCSGLRGDNHAISETAAAQQVDSVLPSLKATEAVVAACSVYKVGVPLVVNVAPL